ncbi:MAG: hypothetical protein Q9166_005541 [cf. Caloplaca sp. 2 TL-2023]
MAGPKSTSEFSTTSSLEPAIRSSSPHPQTTNLAQVRTVDALLANRKITDTPINQPGSTDAPATPLTKPCEFNSCPTGSPPQGFNASNPRLNYVNSYPVTSMRYGIETLSPKFFGGAPELAVAGFNVGGTSSPFLLPSYPLLSLPIACNKVELTNTQANLGTTTLISGTVGAATSAAKLSIPAIAFSGTTGSQTAWTAPIPTYVSTYADLSTNITSTLIASGKPFLPSNIWLNVNYPASTSSSCRLARDFKFVLSRINAASSGTAADVTTCGKSRLPTENKVVGTAGCYASISVGRADTKGDASKAEQAVVLGKFGAILSCLPS